MTGYKRHTPIYLVDATDTPVGVIDRLGREWLFPASLSVAPDGGSIGNLAFGQLLHDDTDTPIGYQVFGREFIFAAPFTANTTRGLRQAKRPLLLSAAGVPQGLFVKSGIASQFAPVPVENGTVSSAALYLGHVGTRGVMNQQITTTSKQAQSAKYDVAVDDLVAGTSQLLFINFYVDSSSGTSTYAEINCGGPATWSAMIEYPIGNVTRSQVTFSGSASGVCADGSTLLGLINVSIPKGQPFIVHSFVQYLSTGTVAHSGTGNVAGNVTPTFNQNLGDRFNVAVSGLTDITAAGVNANGGAGQNGGHYLVLTNTRLPSVYNVGTSIDHGQNGLQDSLGVEGIVSRAIVATGRIGFANCGVKGDWYSFSKTHSTKRLALAQYFTHAVFGGPVNDIYAHSQTGAQALASLQALYTLYSGLTIIQETCTVAGAGASGTTPSGFEPQRAAFNALLLPSAPAPITYIFDCAAVLANAGVPGTWAFAGDTIDGTHPSQQGYIRVANSGAVNTAQIFR